jgi:hypothetical protein
MSQFESLSRLLQNHVASFDRLRMRRFSQRHQADAILVLPHPEPVEGRKGGTAAKLKF